MTPTEIAGQVYAMGLADRVADLYNMALAVGVVLALGILVYAGVRYSASGGNPSAIGNAKAWIWAALIGLVLLFGVYIFLNVINPNLLTLTDPTAPQNVPQPPPNVNLTLPGAGGPSCLTDGQACNPSSVTDFCCSGECVLSAAGVEFGTCQTVGYDEADECVAVCAAQTTCNTSAGFYPNPSICGSRNIDNCHQLGNECSSLPDTAAARGQTRCIWWDPPPTGEGTCVTSDVVGESCTEGYVHPLGSDYCSGLNQATCLAETDDGLLTCAQECEVFGTCDIVNPGTFGCILKLSIGDGCYIDNPL